jgi:hypothetical protein
MPKVMVYVRAEDARLVESVIFSESLEQWVRRQVRNALAELRRVSKAGGEVTHGRGGADARGGVGVLSGGSPASETALADVSHLGPPLEAVPAPQRVGGRKARQRTTMCEHRIPATAFCPTCDG